MTEPAVKINEKALRRFRKRAIAAYRAGVEYIEILAGHVTNTLITVVEFFTTEHTATKTNVTMTGLEKTKEEIREAGLCFLGTIHSHPDVVGFPSEDDNEWARELKEKVCAILEIWKPKKGTRVLTKLNIWWPQYEVKRVRMYSPKAPAAA